MNERVVFRTVRALRPVTRAEVARQTQLSKPTVSLALRSLEIAGLVMEAGHQPSGRWGVLYEPVADAALAIGAELDADAVRAVLTDLDGNELSRCSVGYAATSAQNVFAAVIAAVAELVTGRRRQLLRTVVVGAPGIIDRTSGVLTQSGVLPVLDGSVPAAILSSALGVPVSIVNDVDLAAIGEQVRGRGRGRSDFAVISIGAGMGAAMVLNGQLYLGSRGGAGEIDDIPFRHAVRSRPPVSPAIDGMTGLAAALAPRFRSTGLRPPYGVDAVFDALDHGDRLAVAVVDRLGEWTSWFAASLAAVVDPELIVLAGPIGAREPLAHRVRLGLADLLPVVPLVEVSELGAGSVLAGAAATASDRALQAALDERSIKQRDPGPPARSNKERAS
jgi:predicted NBD/HSP70 family sugar kinase